MTMINGATLHKSSGLSDLISLSIKRGIMAKESRRCLPAQIILCFHKAEVTDPPSTEAAFIHK